MKYRVIAQCEISRTNITPKAFYGYCKREVERRTGGKMHLTDWLDSFNDWEKPNQEYEYHTTKHEEWGADARTETIKVNPFDVQWYLQGSYNFIMEFQFWDEKTGFGYLYMVETEEEPEQPTEPTEPTETETNEQEENTMYNYTESMKADILDYIAENIDRGDYDSREEMEESLNDELWPTDEICGNGTWGYGKYHEIDADTIRGYVRDNMQLCKEALQEFCVESQTIIDKFFADDYSYFDATIRCYCLNWALNEALDELKESGYFDEAETDNSDIDELTENAIETA